MVAAAAPDAALEARLMAGARPRVWKGKGRPCAGCGRRMRRRGEELCFYCRRLGLAVKRGGPGYGPRVTEYGREV
jgi:hypothetical protein